MTSAPEPAPVPSAPRWSKAAARAWLADYFAAGHKEVRSAKVCPLPARPPSSAFYTLCLRCTWVRSRACDNFPMHSLSSAWLCGACARVLRARFMRFCASCAHPPTRFERCCARVAHAPPATHCPRHAYHLVFLSASSRGVRCADAGARKVLVAAPCDRPLQSVGHLDSRPHFAGTRAASRPCASRPHARSAHALSSSPPRTAHSRTRTRTHKRGTLYFVPLPSPLRGAADLCREPVLLVHLQLGTAAPRCLARGVACPHCAAQLCVRAPTRMAEPAHTLVRLRLCVPPLCFWCSTWTRMCGRRLVTQPAPTRMPSPSASPSSACPLLCSAPGLRCVCVRVCESTCV